MSFILTYFHMYWKIKVLQDIYMDMVKNIVKMRNPAKLNADSSQEIERRPTYLANLGPKPTEEESRPKMQPPCARRPHP